MSIEIVSSKTNIYNQEIVLFKDYIYTESLEKNELWEKVTVENIVKFIGEGEFLDIGANVGLITLGVISQGKNNKIHCFECDQNTFNLLLHNTKIHENVTCYPVAISDKQELCQLTRNDHNLGCNFIHNSISENECKVYQYDFMSESSIKTVNNIFIPAINLDSISYIFKNNITIIKIDVEGFELKVLKGAVKLILQHRPTIIIEIWDNNLKDVLTLLTDLNYKIHKYTNSQDYICLPKQDIEVVDLFAEKNKNEI